uniref:Putative secreted protein n=1 Tax=Anopheles darlingi TaxID=43151 RepID=A0A2M4D4K4_ANODA
MTMMMMMMMLMATSTTTTTTTSAMPNNGKPFLAFQSNLTTPLHGTERSLARAGYTFPFQGILDSRFHLGRPPTHTYTHTSLRAR